VVVVVVKGRLYDSSTIHSFDSLPVRSFLPPAPFHHFFCCAQGLALVPWEGNHPVCPLPLLSSTGCLRYVAIYLPLTPQRSSHLNVVLGSSSLDNFLGEAKTSVHQEFAIFFFLSPVYNREVRKMTTCRRASAPNTPEPAPHRNFHSCLSFYSIAL
jgi:hypothetical protein